MNERASTKLESTSERPSRLSRLSRYGVPLVLATLLGVLVLGRKPSASAYVLEGTAYRWNANTAIVLSLQLGTNGQGVLQDGSANYNVVAQNAANLWNNFLGSNVRFVTLTSGTGSSGKTDSMNSVFFDSTFFGQAFGNAVAITNLQSDSTAMVEVDTVVNTGLPYDSYRGALQFPVYDLRRVLIHEFGHMLGLDHSLQAALPFPIMHASVNNTDVMLTDDINGIHALYNGPTVSPTPTPTPTPIPVAPGQTLSAAVGHVYSSPGDPVGGGVESMLNSATGYANAVYRIDTESGTGRMLHRFIFPKGGVAGTGEWVFTFATPAGQSTLTAGTFNSITAANHGLATNYDVSANFQGTSSTVSSAQLVIYPDVQYSSGTTLSTLAADFRITQSSTSGAPLFLTGQIRFNSAQPLPAARIVNLSTRVQVGTGAAQAIAGFVLSDSGGAGKQALVRLLGPSLVPFGVTGVLDDPLVNVYNSTPTLIGQDDDWANPGYYPSPQAPIIQLGLEPRGRTESIFLNRFAAGAYTAVATGFDNGTGPGTGVALVELYDLEIGSDARAINVSTRGMVGTGGNVMIGGFVIQGPGTKQVIVRAIGPSLTAFGVPGALANPTLTVYNSANQPIATNDDWQSDPNAATIMAKGFAPTNPLESATYLVLNPGAYTAIVSGVGGTTGIGLVEIYDAD